MEQLLNGLAHVGVYVSDVERSRKFYEDILGFTYIGQSVMDSDQGPTDLIFLKQGDLTLELVHKQTFLKNCNGYVDHIAFSVKNVEEVEKKLREQGVKFQQSTVRHEPQILSGIHFIHFYGPDGERLELYRED